MSGDVGRYNWYIKYIQVWQVVQADSEGRVHFWVTPGSYLRCYSPDGVLSLVPVKGWRLFLHRLLWGFNGLVVAS